jgi:hypothetical protein
MEQRLWFKSFIIEMQGEREKVGGGVEEKTEKERGEKTKRGERREERVKGKK